MDLSQIVAKRMVLDKTIVVGGLSEMELRGKTETDLSQLMAKRTVLDKTIRNLLLMV